MTATKRALATLAPFALVLLLPSGLHARSSRMRSGHTARVQTGLDALEAEKFAPLRGKHIGLITNHTGVDAEGRRNIDVLAKAPGVTLVALFSPEHGLAGRADENVGSTKDPTTSLPVYSLYGD
ncbi:MAG TPA: exo-beta-N-acetylmuramidase NamZ domain-containing protein, partial [Candidatus Acidoferrum sp.]